MNKNRIRIEKYNEKYKGVIINLILEIQQNEFHIPIKITDRPDLNGTPKFYQINNGQFWVALINNEVMGTLRLIDIGNNQGVLRKMFVKKYIEEIKLVQQKSC